MEITFDVLPDYLINRGSTERGVLEHDGARRSRLADPRAEAASLIRLRQSSSIDWRLLECHYRDDSGRVDGLAATPGMRMEGRAWEYELRLTTIGTRHPYSKSLATV